MARSAGRVGIDVFAVREGRYESATRSRYIRGALALAPGAPEHAWVQALLDLRARFAGAVLLPIDDPAAILVGDCQEELAAHYRLPIAPAGVHRRMASKRQLDALCRRIGVPVPESTHPADRAELLEQADLLGFPVVLKRSEPWVARHHPSAPSVAVAHTRSELLEQYARMESDVAPQIMLQAHIPGNPDSDWMFNGYVDGHGHLACAFTGRKLRHRGRGAGPTALGVCSVNEPLDRLARLVLSELGYRGIVDMDFRYDRRDGSYKLLDVNPRLGSTFRLFVADNGIDVVRAMHLDLTGRAVPRSTISNGRRWLDERSDAASAVRQAAAGRLSLKPWLRSLRGVAEGAWWAADDPLPAVSMGAQTVPYGVRVLSNVTRR